jgi:hypothetical protein
MTTEPDPSGIELPSATLEERLGKRVNMLTQLLILAGIVVMLQFSIMLKMLIETSK